MSKEKTIYDLGLHEVLELPKGALNTIVQRVPGGWIYNTWSFSEGVGMSESTTFVPYSKEFAPKKETKTREATDKPKSVMDVYLRFIINGILPDEAWDRANKFINHYDACGWKLGSGKIMRNWKAAVDGTWTSRDRTLSSNERRNMEDIANLLKKFYGDKKDRIEDDILQIKRKNPGYFKEWELPDNWSKMYGEI